MSKLSLIILNIFYAANLLAQVNGHALDRNRLIFFDDFHKTELDSSWIIETSETAGNAVKIINGQLQLNTKGGITLWYKQKLNGNLLIEYDRTIVMQSGIYDRLSDLNQFWMATDPTGKIFKRKGGFREYDTLAMYYVGMGGNYNTTTRMRRYNGSGKLQIIKEYTDSAHLLRANKTYHIRIIIKDGESKFLVDGQEFFWFKDPEPLREGWFAIRSTKSRQLIDNFKVWQIE